MIHKHLAYYKEHIKQDIPASVAVFLVALPLCLGIAMASGAPLFAGLIAGVIGGLVVSLVSGSQLSVSGPAAGLTVIVFMAIEQLGSFSAFLAALVIAGILQVIMGYVKAGKIGAFFPSAVIKAMLTAIGLILIIKQIPHALGYDVSFEGDESYMAESAGSSFSELFSAFAHISIGATSIAVVALVIMVAWDTKWMKRFALVRLIPSALIAVIWGVIFNSLALSFAPELAVSAKHLVALPITNDITEFAQYFQTPDFTALANPQVYVVAVTIAIIASLETLLSLEAVDKLDPLKRTSPTNKELKAQGLGNILSGLIGGIPMTAVIVRSSASINAGGRTKAVSFLHAIWMIVSVVFFASFINQVPLASLAAILLYIGYKLANPKLLVEMYKHGMSQFLPFVITIVAILATDLLQGIAIGIIVGLIFVMKANYQEAITLEETSTGEYILSLNKDVSFLNKSLLRHLLFQIKEDSHVFIDGSRAQFVDHDIMETIEDFVKAAVDDNIIVKQKFYVNVSQAYAIASNNCNDKTSA